ncbi:GGDEF domain-containing protein [Vibrio tritonius]|uniref:GGDEF domain-containing protein n=1 Tax=Vibrio tritonius TaxID=1435069 RepID=UPI00083802BF|nr:GGDEF domain-containing protein [Vibrio tritonius]
MNIYQLTSTANIVNVLGTSAIACFFLHQVSMNITGEKKQAANRFFVGFFLLGFAFISFSFSFDSWAHQAWSTLFNNMLYVAACYSLLIGVISWYQYTISRRHIILMHLHIILFGLVQVAIYLYVANSEYLRIALCVGTVACILFCAFVFAWRHRRPEHQGEKYICLAMLVCFAASLIPFLLLMKTESFEIYGLSIVVTQILASDFLLGALMSLFLFDQINWHYRRSIRDELTGLYNRRYFRDQLAEHVSVHGQRGIVAMIDIDHFKKVNDAYGHDVGDKVMINVADVLQEHIPMKGVLARYGGEEFVMYAPWPNLGVARTHLDEIRKAIEKQIFYGDGYRFGITISIGCAQLSADIDVVESVKCADHALYQSKVQGRNQVTVMESRNATGLHHRPA